MSDEITRKDVDDPSRYRDRKDSYKNRHFSDKQSAPDEYAGGTIYYSSRKHTKDRSAEVDHVVPLDKLIERYGDKVPPEELRRMANSDYNLAMTNGRLNNDKRAAYNHEYLLGKLKEGNPENALTSYNMMKAELQGEVAIRSNLAVNTVVRKTGEMAKLDKQAVKDAASRSGQMAGDAAASATSAALMSLTVSGINNLAQVGAGDKDLDAALKDVGRDTAGSFAAGAGVNLMQKALVKSVESKGSLALKAAIGKGLPMAKISAGIMVGGSVIKYVNDEISMEECATEIVMNGAGIAAYSLGMALGGPAGAVIASVVSAEICKVIMEYKSIGKMAQDKYSRINALASQALIEMELQRNYLLDLTETRNLKWDQAFDEGFEQIFVAAFSDDVDGAAAGLDRILGAFDKNVRFSSFEEFDEFFMDEDAEFTF